MIKRLSIEHLRTRNLSNLCYIESIIKSRYKKHRMISRNVCDIVDVNSNVKVVEYHKYLNDIRKAIKEKQND